MYAFITLRIRETTSEMQMKKWNPEDKWCPPTATPSNPAYQQHGQEPRRYIFPCGWEPPFWNVLQRSFGLTFGPLLWTHSHGVVASQPLRRLFQPWRYTPRRRDVARSISTWWQGLWVASIPQEEWAEVCTCSVQFDGSPSGLIFSLLDGPVASWPAQAILYILLPAFL